MAFLILKSDENSSLNGEFSIRFSDKVGSGLLLGATMKANIP